MAIDTSDAVENGLDYPPVRKTPAVNSNPLMASIVSALIIGGMIAVGMMGAVWIWTQQQPGPPPVNPSYPPLASLVPDQVEAGLIGAFYRDFAHVVRTSQNLKTTGQFRTAQQQAVITFLAAHPMEANPALNAEIDRRIQAAIGLDDTLLDPAKRETLARTLDQIAIDLGVEPIETPRTYPYRHNSADAPRSTWQMPMLAAG